MHDSSFKELQLLVIEHCQPRVPVEWLTCSPHQLNNLYPQERTQNQTTTTMQKPQHSSPDSTIMMNISSNIPISSNRKTWCFQIATQTNSIQISLNNLQRMTQGQTSNLTASMQISFLLQSWQPNMRWMRSPSIRYSLIQMLRILIRTPRYHMSLSFSTGKRQKTLRMMVTSKWMLQTSKCPSSHT